mmetsp:Transcript_26799/g.79201  ORF Transcript_26799/g.79201 Transcript_26799/m.79201 type:complete len:86 (-) Transcript_26799:260-517(-)
MMSKTRWIEKDVVRALHHLAIWGDPSKGDEVGVARTIVKDHLGVVLAVKVMVPVDVDQFVATAGHRTMENREAKFPTEGEWKEVR